MSDSNKCEFFLLRAYRKFRRCSADSDKKFKKLLKSVEKPVQSHLIPFETNEFSWDRAVCVAPSGDQKYIIAQERQVFQLDLIAKKLIPEKTKYKDLFQFYRHPRHFDIVFAGRNTEITLVNRYFGHTYNLNMKFKSMCNMVYNYYRLVRVVTDDKGKDFLYFLTEDNFIVQADLQGIEDLFKNNPPKNIFNPASFFRAAASGRSSSGNVNDFTVSKTGLIWRTLEEGTVQMLSLKKGYDKVLKSFKNPNYQERMDSILQLRGKESNILVSAYGRQTYHTPFTYLNLYSKNLRFYSEMRLHSIYDPDNYVINLLSIVQKKTEFVLCLHTQQFIDLVTVRKHKIHHINELETHSGIGGGISDVKNQQVLFATGSQGIAILKLKFKDS